MNSENKTKQQQFQFFYHSYKQHPRFLLLQNQAPSLSFMNEEGFQIFLDVQERNCRSYDLNNLLPFYRSPESVKQDATPTKSSDESVTKSSNVIKIFNPLYHNDQDKKEEDSRPYPNGPHSQSSRNYEYMNALECEQIKYLEKDNADINSQSEEGKELLENEESSSSQLEDNENLSVDDAVQQPYLAHIQPYSDEVTLKVESNPNDSLRSLRDDHSTDIQTLQDKEGTNQFQGDIIQAPPGNSQLVKINISQPQCQEGLMKRCFSDAFENEINNSNIQMQIDPTYEEQANSEESKQIQQNATTIRLNFGNAQVATKQQEVAQPEAKRHKTTDSQIDSINHQIIQNKTVQERYDEIFKQAISEGLYYNRQMTQIRHQNREHFALETMKRVQERNQLHQNHNSFLHSNYQPGVSFLTFLNTMQGNYSFTPKSNGYMNVSSQNVRHQTKQYGGFNVPQTPQNQTALTSAMKTQQTFNYFAHPNQYKSSIQTTSNQNIPRVPFGIQTANKPMNGNYVGLQDSSRTADQNVKSEKSHDSSPNKKEMAEQNSEKMGIDQSSFMDQSQQQNLVKANSIGSNDFVCITCHRGPPFTRKYAKNQCQTCYKKTKKFQKDSEDYYMYQGMQIQSPQGFQQPYPPNSYDMSNSNGFRSYIRSSNIVGQSNSGRRNSMHANSMSEEHELQQEIGE